ncbi:MAG: hypothetical protein M3P06_12415 [Acidobacteriota bacterium]|nr:hypothetical protein [Acidobacteriota bacterium]
MATESSTTGTKSDVAKELKDVIGAIESVTKLESELQQQLGKSDASQSQRQETAEDLARAIRARQRLIEDRRALLDQLA